MATGGRLQSDIRSEFSTKEGVYRNIKASEHCRPSRQALLSKELSPVRVSLVSCKDTDGQHDWILFNSGKELYFYPFEGVGKIPDLKRPVDKRVYKSPTVPVCHDFNLITRSTNKLDLIVGFSTGPLQYLNPLERQAICAFNEDGSVDDTKVTCVKWVPGSENTFVSSHRSGKLYVWTTEHSGKSGGAHYYHLHSEFQDTIVHSLKPKSKSSVLFRWSIGHGPINAFAFSPNSTHLAVVSQDGFLRVYDFHKQELYGRMRSYFGGLLCVCWSPDGKYAVTGGEDDLIAVWSFEHRKVVARGEGHKSYIGAISFDPYTTILPPSRKSSIVNGTDSVTEQDTASSNQLQSESRTSVNSAPFLSRGVSEVDLNRDTVAYRLGSVGQDTQLCLWDLSGDTLKLRRPFSRSRSRMSRQASRPEQQTEESTTTDDKRDLDTATTQDSTALASKETDHLTPNTDTATTRLIVPNHTGAAATTSLSNSNRRKSPSAEPSRDSAALSLDPDHFNLDKESSPSVTSQSSERSNGKKEKKHKKDKGEKKIKIYDKKHSLRDPMKKMMKFVGGIGHHNNHHHDTQARRSVGTFESCISDDIAPKMQDVNLMEPLVAKKISQERLTELVFREDCIITACHEGFIQTWARPSTELPPEAMADYNTQPQSPSSDTNAGINSPKPGSGSEAPAKNTSV